MTKPTVLLNAITALTHRPLHLAGHQAISKLKRPDSLNISIKTHDHVQSWNSIFSGISVITNRITPEHRDTGGAFPWYDLLLSCGKHHNAHLQLKDVKAQLSYSPGTVVMVCGKVLNHSLPEWSGGERICVAHWMRKEVHHRLNVYSPSWCWQSAFIRLMNSQFVREQKWDKKDDGSGK
jgi:hypothetical protein